jgi:hypothetical protein
MTLPSPSPSTITLLDAEFFAPKKKPPANLGEAHRRDPRWGARGSCRPACAGGTQAQGGVLSVMVEV